jgi:diguanylate cyclase (GGDEF)-like protein
VKIAALNFGKETIKMKHKSTEKLFQLAYTDMMTGTYNRNAYEERLKKLRKQSANLHGITVIVLDVNGLKEINDTYGHHTGDEAIKTVASFLEVSIGEKADIYRIGGDEFVCIATGNVGGYISEFKDMIGFQNNDVPYTLAVSIGYASYDESVDGIDQLIKKCDKLMYKNKKRK